MINYKSIKEVFNILHKRDINYAVLRNYDNLLNDDIYMDGHGDIDLICTNSKEIVKALQAYSNDSNRPDNLGDGTHYYIYLNGEKVSLDLRHVGDGYYCEKWEQEMLNKRRWHDGFYILGEADHFYSLIYHAILQKPQLSAQYRTRLTIMGEQLGLDMKTGEVAYFMALLENYMREHGYHYVYPVDRYVPLKRKHIIDRSLLMFNKKRYVDHLKFQTKVKIIEFLVKVKHSIYGRPK